MRLIIGLLVAVGVVLALAGCTFDGEQSCVSEENCREGRICWDGACTSEMRYKAVAAGTPCAVTVEGKLECWGGRYDPDADADIRVDVPTETGFVDVASGIFNACGLKEDGRAICFGVVQMGVVPSGLRLMQIALDQRPGCGVTLERELVCWDGISEELETIDGQYRSVSIHRMVWCAISENDELRCLQDEQIEVPEVQVREAALRGTPRMEGFPGINLCILDMEKNIKCMDIMEDRDTVFLEADGEFESMAQSSEFACGLKADGTVDCFDYDIPEQEEEDVLEQDEDWGMPGEGFEPEPDEIDSTPPEGVRFESIDGGGNGVCGITVDGRVRCWGRESFAR